MNREDDSTHGIEASQDHDDKEKRKERREKREERREKREERREKREERSEKREKKTMVEAARDPHTRPQEVPKEVPRGLWASWRPDRVRGRGGEAKGRPPKKTNELPRVCFPKILKISGCYEDGRQLESLHFYRVP